MGGWATGLFVSTETQITVDAMVVAARALNVKRSTLPPSNCKLVIRYKIEIGHQKKCFSTNGNEMSVEELKKKKPGLVYCTVSGVAHDYPVCTYVIVGVYGSSSSTGGFSSY